MWNGQDTLYGNEWINYEQTYYKIPVAEDGIYRLSYATLREAGLPVEQSNARRYQLFHLGQEVPLYTPANPNTPLQTGDYLEFYGEQNRAELDRFLFQNPEEEMLNPYYSMFTDTAAYFLTLGAPETTGKRYREVENEITIGMEKEEWYWGETKKVLSESHLKKYVRVPPGISVYYSHFDVAEGFASKGSNDLLRKQQEVQRVTLPLDGLYEGGPAARFITRYACGLGNHRQQVRVEGTVVDEREFAGFKVQQLEAALPAGLLQGRNQVTVEFQGLVEGGQETQAIAGVILRYPRTFDFDNASSYHFELPASERQRYIEIQNFDLTEGALRLYNLTNQEWLQPEVSGGIIRIAVSPSAVKQNFWLINEVRGVREVETLAARNFINYAEEEADYLLLTHAALQRGNQNQVQAYADYRASAEGGAFRTMIVDVEQLYDQYGYGLARHPQGIRNFGFHVNKIWQKTPHVLIIGKGREYPNIRRGDQLQQAIAAGTFYVPSFGYPASDHLFFSTNTSSKPVFPTGRIATVAPGEIDIYLRKVKAVEAQNNQPQTLEAREWMKRVIHLGGGASTFERQSIQNNLNRMKQEVEENTFGANVVSFFKSTSDPIQNSLTEQIFEQINAGSSLLTFFGHSSPGTFDFNIDNPDNYFNQNKYPVMLSLGCYSGNIFTEGKSISERFTFYEDKGAVAFGASRGPGYISALYQFADRFYELLGSDYYGAGIGEILQAVYQYFGDRTDLPMGTLVEQFMLHGDPAIRFHPTPGPDYVVDAGSVQFEPRVVTTQQDSFQLRFDVVNLGRYTSDTITVEITQQFPGGEREVVRRDTIPAPAYASTQNYWIINPGKQAVGRNTFFIRVDADEAVAELPAPAAEQNNELVRSSGEAGVTMFIVDNAARPVFPPDFAIVNTPEVVLKASTTNALAPERTYVLQLDTTARFDSPRRLEEKITQRGGVIKWSPGFPWQENEVYYWRISPDSINPQLGYVWENSSFTYLPGSQEGWSQGDYWQWLEGTFDQTRLDEDSREFTFDYFPIDIRIKNKIWDGIDRPGLFYNNDGLAGSVKPWDYLDEGIAVVVSDPKTASFWRNPSGGDYGSVDTRNNRVFAFPTKTTEQRQLLINFLEDRVPDGYFIFLFTILGSEDADLTISDWPSDSTIYGTNIFEYLEQQGSASIRLLQTSGTVPYIIMYEKGGEVLDESIGSNITDEVNTGAVIPKFFSEGNYVSPLIGPAKSWESVEWSIDPSSLEEHDSLQLQVYGIDAEENMELLNEQEITEKGSLVLNDFSTSVYPYLRLKFSFKDQDSLTIPEPEFWRVYFEGLPDLALNPSSYYSFQRDTLQRGEKLKLEFDVENITKVPIGGVKAQYTLIDLRQQSQVYHTSLSPLAGGENARLAFELDSASLAGTYQLLIELNPGTDGPKELHKFNNLVQQSFTVVEDRKNPILSVTFDGVYIMDGDLISSRPNILLQLDDENPFLELADTALFDIQLITPEGNVEKVYFSSPEVQFFPVTQGQTNRARVEFTPTFEKSGEYELRVQANDVAGNPSGKYAFRRSFEVITERMISNVFNYPNPFSQSTQFVYTLTGDQPPPFYKIQIMTISGRIVKEITQDEMGPLKIGTHRTEYRWNGTDEYGDKLANGVYIYRVVVKDDTGSDYKKYDNGTDMFFKKGMGKLVILR